MFQCAYCKSDIGEDGFYCDQCGKEIYLCETCLQPRQGEWCSEDGGTLVAAKKNKTPQAIEQQTQPVQVQVPPAQTPVTPITSSDPVLKLVNSNLGLTLEIRHDTILGRTTGPHASSLANLNAISGKHLLFLFDKNKGWTFQDTGSSNGTKYNSASNSWQTISKVTAHTPVVLKDKEFLLIGNVEFSVHIQSSSPASTQRI